MNLDNRKKSEQWVRNKATEYVALDTDLTFAEWCYQEGRADERKRVLDEAYDVLADKLIWVLDNYGCDTYIEISQSIQDGFAEVMKGEPK